MNNQLVKDCKTCVNKNHSINEYPCSVCESDYDYSPTKWEPVNKVKTNFSYLKEAVAAEDIDKVSSFLAELRASIICDFCEDSESYCGDPTANCRYEYMEPKKILKNWLLRERKVK